MCCVHPKPSDERQQLASIANSLDILKKRFETIEAYVSSCSSSPERQTTNMRQTLLEGNLPSFLPFDNPGSFFPSFTKSFFLPSSSTIITTTSTTVSHLRYLRYRKQTLDKLCWSETFPPFFPLIILAPSFLLSHRVLFPPFLYY